MRIVHLTFYKCASQWVRDILTDEEISAVTGFSLSLNSVDVKFSQWPEQPAHTFAGPIYSASSEAWLANSLPDDRAIVVVRDPRDLVVSLMYSVAFNHAPTVNTLLLRNVMQHASTKDRVRLGMHLITGWADTLRSWGGFQGTGREYFTSYEGLTKDPGREFRRILQFLGWNLPDDILNRVLTRFSFAKMTGRNQGESNVHSHHRKGISGDWHNYFDRDLGYEFEATFPGMLTALGYADTDKWFESLAAELPELREDAVPESEAQKLLVQVATLEHLHQQVVDSGFWRNAAEERLADVEKLTAMAQQLRANVAELDVVANERLADVDKLHVIVKQLRRDMDQVSRTADARLDLITQLHASLDAAQRGLMQLEASIREIEMSFSYRFGFRPLAALGGMWKRVGSGEKTTRTVAAPVQKTS